MPACCLPDDPAAAWSRPRALLRALVEEPHFSVRIVACACGQRFASVFCERIDWSGGNDPQDWLLIPITPEEAATLTEDNLTSLAPERHLVRTFPSDADAPAALWRTGPIWLPRHD